MQMSRQHRRFELMQKEWNFNFIEPLTNVDGGSALEICARGKFVSRNIS